MRASAAAPAEESAPESAAGPASDGVTPMAETPAAAKESGPLFWKRAGTAALVLALPVAITLGWHLHSQGRTSTETKIAVIFASADSPCRHGIASPCFDSIRQIRGLRDYSDASLLLGDYKVARYLPTLPGGNLLIRRWQDDTITEPELLAMGNVAYARNLSVCHSFWMYAQIKRDHLPVPQFTINGNAPLPPQAQ